MIRRTFSQRWALAVMAMLSCALMPRLIYAASGYVQHNLASDIPLLADFTDPNMVNPWGLALSPFWPCNNGTGTYDVNGPNGSPTATVTKVPLAGGKAGQQETRRAKTPACQRLHLVRLQRQGCR